MKKILSIAAALTLAVQCFATGPVPVNTPQSGFANFTTNGSAFILYTNTFEPAFTYTPAMTLFLSSGATNALPFTNTVTTTNFILSINTPTNCTVQWVATPIVPRIEYGTVTNVANAQTSVTFPTPYAQIPVVFVSTQQTNSTGVAVTSISLTNFTFVSGVTTNNNWISFGPAAYPSQAASATAPGNVNY